MRSLLIATAAIAAMTAGDASAQRMVAHGPGAAYPAPGIDQAMPPPMTPASTPVGHPHGNRWGSKIGGHWWAGANAPGGWDAYRQPHRGLRLPGYWNTSRFYISDWADYGLSRPPYGYNWARYYDDAVLIDDRGSVYDTVGGLDWDGYDDGYAGSEAVYAGKGGGADYAPRGAVQPTYGQSTYAPGHDQHRGNGVGGITGYTVDSETSAPHLPRYGAHYRQPPVAPVYAPPPPAGYAPPPPPRRGGWVSPDGTTTVTTTTGGGYYGGGSTTTVVVQSAPVVTTTTTEIYEDAVTYSRPHTVWRKRVWHKPVWRKPACVCR